MTSASVDAALTRLPAGDIAVVRDGANTVLAAEPDAVVTARGPEAFRALGDLGPGWWAGFLAYDLGRGVERVPELADDDLGLPDLVLARFPNRVVIRPDGSMSTIGSGIGSGPGSGPLSPLEGWHSSLDRAAFKAAVERIIDHLRAGDCYQVNLTRRLSCAAESDPVALFRTLLAGNPAPHAALLRIGDVSVVSASPERFLRREGAEIVTRPIKGTAAERSLLEASAKDRAENVMIVDLARNDLGRLCEYGSVTVPALCAVEAHPGLYHLVSTVRGTLRPDVGVADIIRATFPPASVTGCPKPRVLDIIETLEPVRRGIYCGAVGFIDTENDVIDLNVAIRTFTITGGQTHFGVGGGIVADSDPGAEWEETELKARRLLSLAAGVSRPA